MDRPSLRNGCLVALLVFAVVVLPSGGCRTLVTTVAYLVRGTDIKAEYNGLKEKRVAVVCRPVASLTYGCSLEARELAREVGFLLSNRVSKIEVIDHAEVNDWTDNHEWDEFTEIGEELGADMVVGIDLEHFGIRLDQTLYQGKANATISVYDCSAGNKLVFERELPQIVYPPNSGVWASETSEKQFERKFLKVLADYIGRHFYAHDAYADYALDASAME